MGEVFDAFQSEKFLKRYIPVSKNQLVKSIEEIKIKTPLVLKIISKDALHKTEINGVRIIKSNQELKSNFKDLIKTANKKKIKLKGIMVQEFYKGEQLIIGIKKDPVFNHVILFGLGGIFTEVLDDISIRKCPISLQDAQEMIFGLKAKKIFEGFRGKKLNTTLLKKVLVEVSKIPINNKKITELDINPFILNGKSGKVVDSRIIFSN